jgi:hypothetical protein
VQAFTLLKMPVVHDVFVVTVRVRNVLEGRSDAARGQSKHSMGRPRARRQKA